MSTSDAAAPGDAPGQGDGPGQGEVPGQGDAPVLIVGGSLVGLSAAVFLAHHGVRCTLVERHPGTSVHPRAVGYYPRTAELLRQAGVEDAAKRAAAGFETHRTRAGVTSLSGEVLFSKEELEGSDDLAGLTPCRLLLLPQDRLEPLLRARAEELGADLRFGTELLSFAEDPDGVTAVLGDGTGGTSTFRSAYLVACDGPRSTVRESLKVPRQGRGVLSRHVSIAFGADLSGVLGERRYSVVHVKNPQVMGILVHDDTLTEGTLIVGYRPEDGESLDDFTDARCAELVGAAIGSPDVEVTIRSRFPWDMAEQVAEGFVHGRVLLAGDAAHVIPPTGGYGANTGIADAHNLAWKLALVVGGAAGTGLLETYDAERGPVGAYTAEQGSLQLAVRSGSATPEQQAAAADALTVTMGQPYRSTAVVPEPGAEPLPAASDPRALHGEPGTRAPHTVLLRGGAEISALDLYGRAFVLLAAERGGAWTAAASAVAEEFGVELAAHRVVPGPGDGPEALVSAAGRWSESYGVGPAGAVLVRPDGVVAWRSHGAVPAGEETAVLTAVLRRVLARG
ncbi:FAD-dependent monooxygenase [Streptomyces sp. FIT100]|uniref:FAD-dependent monooxygenase n=1 Tax=Streptomyces sp. FIT100 TaxID=2837956 RepID=UPI0021C94862|nr:FAD-dependent monooxygenase [Streptomyces sp. FIT100]UUN27426.1 FAD-dependent monooxygenase [Streptomyces sp. FIT100]